MTTISYAGYILSAYGLAALMICALVLRAVMARRSVLKALHALEPRQDESAETFKNVQTVRYLQSGGDG